MLSSFWKWNHNIFFPPLSKPNCCTNENKKISKVQNFKFLLYGSYFGQIIYGESKHRKIIVAASSVCVCFFLFATVSIFRIYIYVYVYSIKKILSLFILKVSLRSWLWRRQSNMESQASLMVNCMLLAFRKLRLYDDVDNSNYTIFTNITSTLNFTMLDSQRADNDSLEANALDSPSYHRNIYQWVAKITLFVGPVSFIMQYNVHYICVCVSIPFKCSFFLTPSQSHAHTPTRRRVSVCICFFFSFFPLSLIRSSFLCFIGIVVVVVLVA